MQWTVTKYDDRHPGKVMGTFAIRAASLGTAVRKAFRLILEEDPNLTEQDRKNTHFSVNAGNPDRLKIVTCK